MTERKAWLTIAVAHATPKHKRTTIQNSLVGRGICWSISCLWWGGKISSRQAMMTKIIESMPPDKVPAPRHGFYFCPLSPANDLLRADYCYAMYYSNGAE